MIDTLAAIRAAKRMNINLSLYAAAIICEAGCTPNSQLDAIADAWNGLSDDSRRAWVPKELAEVIEDAFTENTNDEG